MELKDVILSTLAEIEELASASGSTEKKEIKGGGFPIKESPALSTVQVVEAIHSVRDGEARMLEGIRERLLVLFEGFQSPNNVQIEAKVDLTLNFLEYLLATIENRLDAIKES